MCMGMCIFSPSIFLNYPYVHTRTSDETISVFFFFIGFDAFGDVLQPINKASTSPSIAPTTTPQSKAIGQDLDTSLASIASNLNVRGGATGTKKWATYSFFCAFLRCGAIELWGRECFFIFFISGTEKWEEYYVVLLSSPYTLLLPTFQLFLSSLCSDFRSLQLLHYLQCSDLT